jgi:hypothetical protein
LAADGAEYRVEPQRKLGELPPPSFTDTFAQTVGRLYTPNERIQQRRIASYLQRLSTALLDIDDIPGWETSGDAVEACWLVLGPERSKDLAETLGWGATAVLDAALTLGYVPEESSDEG